MVADFTCPHCLISLALQSSLVRILAHSYKANLPTHGCSSVQHFRHHMFCQAEKQLEVEYPKVQHAGVLSADPDLCFSVCISKMAYEVSNFHQAP